MTEHDNFTEHLIENGYTDIKLLGNSKWAGIFRFAFTHAIILGSTGDFYSYDDRWCYDSYEKALNALNAWDGSGEPEGWHRHPISGRRRPQGDPLVEYINL